MDGTSNLEPLNRLTKDQRKAGALLDKAEARWMVDTYYQMQKFRITSANQVRALEDAEEPNLMTQWTFDTFDMMEQQIKGGLAKYVDANRVGRWAVSVKGVGPVIAAGFLSRLELRPTAGAWWRFCGLDPTSQWKKGQKRPWNAQLKRLCWLLGESFTKVSGQEDAFYGQIYRQRKDIEVAKNLEKAFAEQAERQLSEKNYGKDTKAYASLKNGMLPDDQINKRAQRIPVKLFLSHMHHVWSVIETGEPPVKPYILTEAGGHAHYIEPPNFLEG